MTELPYTVGEVLVTVQDLHLTLGGKKILDGVSAQVRNLIRPGLTQGQIVALLGPSGIGKTQTFRILAGLNKPDRGAVLVTDKQIPVEEGQVGVVMQHYPLYFDRTVFDNLVYGAMKGGLKRPEAKKKAEEYLERFGLTDRATYWPKDLSGGQRQRVAIAQQLLCSDHLLLMDEPFSGLDPVAKAAAIRLIQEVAALDEKMTIVVVTHDIVSAVTIADTVWLMGRDRDAEGKVVSGAKIQQSIDLVECGLAWHPGIETTPAFYAKVGEILERFKTL